MAASMLTSVDTRPSSLSRSTILLNQRDLLFRWVLVIAQAATIGITWPLWNVHDSPPMLPALDLPAFDMALILMMSLALVLVRPFPGIALHTALVLYAMTIDQTRMQPEVFSLLFLLWGTLPFASLKAIARCHLIAMWFFAGWNKLLSERFHNEMSLRLLDPLPLPSWGWVQEYGGYGIALTEIGVALLLCIPRLRKAGALLAFALHVTILYVLLPTGNDGNPAVWPWNAVLVVAPLVLFVPTSVTLWRHARRPLTGLAMAVILLSPLGWYVEVTDAYLAHHLYSADVPIGRSSALDFSMTRRVFEVPLPPEHRLFRQYFQATCEPGDTLTIEDDRWWYRREQQRVTFVACDR